MKRWWVPVLLSLFLVAELGAQRCISQTRLSEHLQRFPEDRVKREALEIYTRQQQASTPAGVQMRTVAHIPVVFHVVWRLPEENISTEQILSQLIELNKDFRLTNNSNGLIPAIFQPFAADAEINFCMARRTPDGQETDGIVRTNTHLPFVGDRVIAGRKVICYTSDGGSNAWDPNRYINIWVGRRQFFPAEAAFPGGAVAAEDGIIIDPRFVGTTGTAAANMPYHLGRTLTHELGHYFNLYHLWGPGQAGTCTQSDEVADTPVQSKTYLSECPTHPQITCGSADMFMNFMNYTNDACMAMFTLGQKARMWAAINGARQSLLASDGCQPPVSTGELVLPAIRIMGNPVSGSIRVHIQGQYGNALPWQITDLTGKTQKQGRFSGVEYEQIDVSDMPSGLYILQLRYEGVQISRKFIILHH